MEELPSQKLFALGPIEVHPEVSRLIPKNLSHRSPAMFNPLFENISSRILTLLKAKKECYVPLFINGSGTSGVEAIISSFKNRNVLICSNGSFGEKWQKIASHYQKHFKCHIFSVGWGLPLPCDEIVKAAIKKSCDTVMIVHHETSCCVVNDIHKIAECCSQKGLLFFADCVSSFGIEELNLSTPHITGITFGSNKGSMCYPGVSCVIVKRDYCKKLDPNAIPAYLNLRAYFDYSQKSQTPFTPAVQLLQCWNAALEGMENISEICTVGERRFKLLNALLQARGFKNAYSYNIFSHSKGVGVYYLPKWMKITEFREYLEKRGFAIYAYVKGH